MAKATRDEDKRSEVRERYSRLAKGDRPKVQAEPKQQELIKVYSSDDLQGMPKTLLESNCSCGNPVALADLKEGQVVVDLGSGAGLDVFLAAKRVGARGKAIGVDATPEMVWKSRSLAKEMNIPNAEFRLGEIEAMPLESNFADVIISNCVINLAPDKSKVFQEAFRVLKPGGKLAVSDRVLVSDLPEKVKNDPELWCGCVSGALPEQEYIDLIKKAGFVQVEVTDQRRYTESEAKCFTDSVEDEKKKKGKKIDSEAVFQAYLAVANDRVVAYKPL